MVLFPAEEPGHPSSAEERQESLPAPRGAGRGLCRTCCAALGAARAGFCFGWIRCPFLEVLPGRLDLGGPQNSPLSSGESDPDHTVTLCVDSNLSGAVAAAGRKERVRRRV